MNEPQHDPIPDGKTGPWLRKPHLRTGESMFQLAFDDRCPRCRWLMWSGQRWTREYPLYDDEGERQGSLVVAFLDGNAVAAGKEG